MFSEDGFEDGEHCNCEYCSEIETMKLIERTIERILDAKSKTEVRTILKDLSHFSKMVGIKEYVYTNMMDSFDLLEALNAVDFEKMESTEENSKPSKESDNNHPNEIEFHSYDNNYSFEVKSDLDSDDFFTNEFWFDD